MDVIKPVVFFLILSTFAIQILGDSKFKSYVRLVTGFMLLSLLFQPILKITKKEDDLKGVFSQISFEEADVDFRTKARKVQEEQQEKAVQTMLKETGISIKKIKVETNQKGKVLSVRVVSSDFKGKENKMKTLLSDFYNVKESNINISE